MTVLKKQVSTALIVFSIGRLLVAQSSEASLRAAFEQGEKALAEGRLSEAEDIYQKLSKTAPNVAEVYGRLGLVFFEEKRFAEAIPVLQKALKLKPGLPNTDVLLAMSEAEMGRYKEALPGLEKGFRHGTDAALQRMSGLELERAYTGLRRDNDAAQMALELTKRFPDDPEVLYYSGRLFGNYSYLSMQRLVAVAPDSIWRHEATADAFQSAGDYDLAAAEYRKVLELDRRRPGVHYRLGRALLASATHGSTTVTAAEAAKEFGAELELDASNANAAYEFGEIQRKAGDLEKANELFRAAIHYYPDFEEANVGLGRGLLAQGKASEALTFLKKATELDAKDEVAFYQLSLAYKALGKSVEQKAALERFEALKNGKPSTNLLSTEHIVTKQEMN